MCRVYGEKYFFKTDRTKRIQLLLLFLWYYTSNMERSIYFEFINMSCFAR